MYAGSRCARRRLLRRLFGSLCLAARNGWAGSEIYLGRLDRDLRPVGEPWRLDLYHAREANYGREDPRLFMYGGRVHVSYIGVVGGHTILHTSQLYARLDRDLRVERIWTPNVPERKAWEKNWAFFDAGDGLRAVYTIAPDRVVGIDGDRALTLHNEPGPPWSGGEPRGGAPPVRVGDEFWHFFHDRIQGQRALVYRTGLYAFDARPPYRPLRVIPEPIMVADEASRPGDQYAAVMFTCGAVRAGQWWILSSGIHDRWMALDRFRHEDLERKLVAI